MKIKSTGIHEHSTPQFKFQDKWSSIAVVYRKQFYRLVCWTLSILLGTVETIIWKLNPFPSSHAKEQKDPIQLGLLEIVLITGQMETDPDSETMSVWKVPKTTYNVQYNIHIIDQPVSQTFRESLWCNNFSVVTLSNC